MFTLTTRFQVETNIEATVSDGHRSGSTTPRIFIQSPTHISCLNFEARLGTDVTTWTADEVRHWLKVAGFLDVCDDLYGHRVDGFGLTTLSRRVLSMMDIPPHRIFLLMDAISQLRCRTRDGDRRKANSRSYVADESKTPERLRSATLPTFESDSKERSLHDRVLEQMFSDSELIVLSRELANRVTLGRFTVTNNYFADEDTFTSESRGYADDEDSDSVDDSRFGLDNGSYDSGYFEERDEDSENEEPPPRRRTFSSSKKRIFHRKSNSIVSNPSDHTRTTPPDSVPVS